MMIFVLFSVFVLFADARQKLLPPAPSTASATAASPHIKNPQTRNL